jgi:hypothetical protein
MNLHAIFLHVGVDSIRGGGTMLSLYLTAISIKYAEALVCVLEAAAILFVILPIFYASSRILLQVWNIGLSVGFPEGSLHQDEGSLRPETRMPRA